MRIPPGNLDLPEERAQEILGIVQSFIDKDCESEEEAVQLLINNSVRFFLLMEKHVKVGADLRLHFLDGKFARVLLSVKQKDKE